MRTLTHRWSNRWTARPGRVAGWLLASVAAFGCADRAAQPGAMAGADVDSLLAPRIVVSESPTVFTLFAMLNAAGLDDEAREAMHPVRRAVRGALPRLLADDDFARAESYYAARRDSIGGGAYLIAALATSGPPEFKPSHAADTTAPRAAAAPLDGLAALLRDFARAFRADSMYLVHQPSYRAYIADYSAAMRRETGALLRYARVASRAEFPALHASSRTVVIPNLLMAHDHEITFTRDSVRYNVVGPERVVWFRPVAIATDFVAATLVGGAQFDGALAAAAQALDSLRGQAAAPHADSPAAFLVDNVALALVIRYRPARTDADADTRVTAARNAMRAGLVFVPMLVEALEQYEAQTAPLGEYLPKLLANLDAEREIARWREERR